MKKTAFAILFLLFAGCAFASPDTLRLFYPIDKYQLTDQYKSKIKSLIDSIAKDQPVYIKGYADYLGNKAYNQALSERRAAAISAYVLSVDGRIKINAKGLGQVDEAGQPIALGEPHDRRVDIIYSKVAPVKKAEPVEPVTDNFSRKVDSLSSLEVGKSISLDELTFEPGRHVLRYASEPYLRFLTRYLAEHKNLYFEVRGHVCCEPKIKKVARYVNGKYEFVEEPGDGMDVDGGGSLSLNRARVIYNYFAENDIDTARMTYTGVGASQPKIDPEVTEADRQLNRRVEIVILRK